MARIVPAFVRDDGEQTVGFAVQQAAQRQAFGEGDFGGVFGGARRVVPDGAGEVDCQHARKGGDAHVPGDAALGRAGGVGELDVGRGLFGVGVQGLFDFRPVRFEFAALFGGEAGFCELAVGVVERVVESTSVAAVVVDVLYFEHAVEAGIEGC